MKYAHMIIHRQELIIPLREQFTNEDLQVMIYKALEKIMNEGNLFTITVKCTHSMKVSECARCQSALDEFRMR